MGSRFSILPDPRFADLAPLLAERLAEVAASIRPENFASLMDPLLLEVIRRGVEEIGAHEGTVWLPDAAGMHLVPAYNTGPRAADFVGKLHQPLNSGLVSLVFATEQPTLVNAAYADSRHSPLVDQALGQKTDALIAVPFSFLHACRGVISCVRLIESPTRGLDPAKGTLSEFVPGHLAAVQRTSAILGRLIEQRLLGDTIGWSAQ